MTLGPDTVQALSESATQEFLQTVVFIDDQIYERNRGPVAKPQEVISPKGRKKVTKSRGHQSEELPIPDDENGMDEYSPQDIVASFAKKQMVCALYQPKRKAKFSPASEVFALCRTADVVIVDWDFFGDAGKRAMELVKGLVEQAVRDVPEQLRVILVYTHEINLLSVASDLYDTVGENVGDNFRPLQSENGLTLTTLNSRVSIFGKPGRERPGVEPSRVVKESELANAVVNEFAKLADGLLHAIVLRGLAEIKKNSRRVLSKFDAKLDAAFLTHRAMGLTTEDSSSYIIPLLVSEIESVLEDVLPSSLITKSLIQNWCQCVWSPGDHLNFLLDGASHNLREIAESICLRGFKESKETYTRIPKLRGHKNIRKAATILLESEDDKSNHYFSRLMSSRTFYREMPKPLRLGVIVHDYLDDEYFLCLQPVCDSERLKGDRVFLFARLRESETGGQVAHVVEKDDGKIVELYYHAKSFECYVATFSPDRKAERVLAKKSSSAVSEFVDTNKKKYSWIDQLKVPQAQRAIEKLASDLSRVGLTEFEWLRLLEKKWVNNV